MHQGIERGIVLGGLFTLHQKKKGKKKVTDEVAGEEKVLNGGVFQLSSGWVVLMVLLSLSLCVCALRIW